MTGLHLGPGQRISDQSASAPGVTIDSAEAALDAITRRLDEQDPSVLPRASTKVDDRIASGRHEVTDPRKIKRV